MLRTFAIAVAILAALSAGAMAWIYVVTERPGSSSAPRPSAVAAEDAAPAQAPLLPPPSVAAAPGGLPIIPPAAPVPEEPVIPRYAPPAGSWEAIPPVATAAALGPPGVAVARELTALQPQLGACFDEDTAARFGRERVTETQDLERMEDHGYTVLMLEVETGPGRVTIVDAPVETRGTASDGAIACAQRLLKGRAVRLAGAAAPGDRRRVLFNLHP